MNRHDVNRVKFYSKEDMAGPYQLLKGEQILKNGFQSDYNDINDVLELYNIKKYLDSDLYLKKWTQEEIIDFKDKAIEYEKIVGHFMSKINDSNVVSLYDTLIHGYVKSFWELVNNHSVYKQISKINFNQILVKYPDVIYILLTHKQLVNFYDQEIKTFLLTFTKSAEILLSIYEERDSFRKAKRFLPKNLTLNDKENIIINYLDSADINFNYVELIKNARNRSEFKITDKTRLKAKRLGNSKSDIIFSEGANYLKYGVSISFAEKPDKIKEGQIDGLNVCYTYSIDFIKQNCDTYQLFRNFIFLFEFLDLQYRITLISKRSQMGVMERIIGVRSENEYIGGVAFQLSEITSYAQIVSYNKIINNISRSLEDILLEVFTSVFQEKYGFAQNAQIFFPPNTNPYFEKVRLLAPEFESILKQYKLFVEDNNIDFELLQISSSPSSIREIPSLVQNKYMYFNEQNDEMVGCTNLFFSDQSPLTYVESFKEKDYNNFFELLEHEEVNINNLEEYQKEQIKFLTVKGFISTNSSGVLEITNIVRVAILKDLYNNEVASYHHYPMEFQLEAQQMAVENIISFENTLFSKSEQAYFNYYLNKSEFTNGLDLRNSYLHGTQAAPGEIQKHETSYFTYLKLLVLTLLKIEDDLSISRSLKTKK
ncbi:hypothetical protein [Chitinophaga rhizosphaerae]|uniref:hypothetical protein n=1 Tax=Chitinophaga rhizosphaerae TaxID=1864947 RepID=UPI000F81003D|nr:hypothetical protein [Chitinophaga rhizosphaerae]